MSCNCGKTSGGDECKEANHDGLRNESLDPTGLTARRSMTSVTFDRRRARIRHAKRKPRRGLYPPGSTARHLRRMSVSQAPAAEFLSPFCVGVRFLKTIRSLNHLLCIHYEKSRNGDDIGRTARGAAQGPGISACPCPDERVYDAVPKRKKKLDRPNCLAPEMYRRPLNRCLLKTSSGLLDLFRSRPGFLRSRDMPPRTHHQPVRG